MKSSRFSSFAIIAIAILFCSSCRRVIHDRRSPLTDSPESREFVGCRVDGTGYVSEARIGNVQGFCSYESATSPRRTFKLYSEYRSTSCGTITIGITLDSVQLEAGKAYSLSSENDGRSFGLYSNAPCGENKVDLFTNDTITPASITINTLDSNLHVITGTFIFAVQDEFGKVYMISDGIFDRHYSN